MTPQLPKSSLVTISLSSWDAAALLVAIHEAPLAVKKHVEYLEDKLREVIAESNGAPSSLNHDECQVLRYWYIRRGVNAPVTDDGWSKHLAESIAHFGVDPECVNRSKIEKFANSTAIIHHRTHTAPSKEAPRAMKRKSGLSVEDALAALKAL